MGRRGPPPKPEKSKKLAGNPGKRKPKTAPKSAEVASPCPALIPESARGEWKRIAANLAERKAWTAATQGLLTAYCLNYADALKLRGTLDAEGWTFTTEKGYVGARPEASQAAKCWEIVRRIAQDLGVGPVNASRVTVSLDDDAADELDAALG